MLLKDALKYSAAFRVLYEDNHLIAVDKHSGIPVQGDKTGDMPLAEYVKAYLKEKYNKSGNVFLGVIHRLDRPVSGLTLLAKTSKCLERMNKLFSERSIEKVYYAVTDKKPTASKGTAVHWLKKNEKNNVTTAYAAEVPGSKRAELLYEVKENREGMYLWRVKPVTGRHHQIRVQLARLGCPILGDVKYGSGRRCADRSICLHATVLSFPHPVKREFIVLRAPLPRHGFWSPFAEIISE